MPYNTDISVRLEFTGILAVTFQCAIISDTSPPLCTYRAVTYRIYHMRIFNVSNSSLKWENILSLTNYSIGDLAFYFSPINDLFLMEVNL